ncbi:hypothetical protein [Gellertiella hungarica]|uniref:Citrate lyase subunit beta/citryl-CoA lyase n=1 Tax=Gellertiella hungarica TaxID=1572859 RepID=A0A7W6J4W9_9HYPH|nr:hypothetical protein [Gellertiella hungarica]MBB4064861.1 citrate lyase subunit beta/citryl-CoA lyase [Gellertiella hungarica]
MNLAPNGLPVDFLTRSWLVIPPLEEGALAAGMKSGADVVCFDLGAVSRVRRATAAEALCQFVRESKEALQQVGAPAVFFLLPEADDDTDSLLETLMPARPTGLLLTVHDPRDVQELDVLVAVHEAINDIEDGLTRLACLLPHALNADFCGLSRRLIGLGWSAEAFRAHVGARRMLDAGGALSDSFRLARSSVLLAAASAGLEAIDSHSGLWSTDRLARDVQEAAADGFTGKFSLSPRQVSAINHGFTPGPDEVEEARAWLQQPDELCRRDYLRALRVLKRAP